ncbi:rod-determining factor RdfA [Halopenitus salinus]|jgi:hypothetical protein|uniref:Rod-determining factor RdfA n=1 Tax=Halopenitus salinus TaxID=1198295 RepID=A0ABD5UQI9_9EURY
MTTASRPNTKVARVIEKYDLGGLGEDLEEAWTGVAGERTSLRDLADEFNRSVLEAALRAAGETVAEADVESAYSTLTDDDVSRADEMRKRRELERAGVDVDDVLGDFVTHQAIHTYLTDYRGAELPDRSEGLVDRKIETLERLQGRTSAVTESTIETLVSGGHITDRDYQVFLDVRVVCGDCGTDHVVSDLLRDGGCDCEV